MLLALSVKEGSGGQVVGVIFLCLLYFLLSVLGTMESFRVRDEEFHLCVHWVLHLKGRRICHPKTTLFDIKVILRNRRYRRSSENRIVVTLL